MMVQQAKIPKSFVKQFLRARGWKMLHEVQCDCDSEIHDFPKHPIAYLWEHIQKGHTPSFTVCVSWDRQVGRDTGEFEHWYRWYLYTWNPQTKRFDREIQDEGYE